MAFLHGFLQSGIDVMLDLIGFDRLLEGADLVFTGEGRIDGQTLHGKVISGVASRAGKRACRLSRWQAISKRERKRFTGRASPRYSVSTAKR